MPTQTWTLISQHGQEECVARVTSDDLPSAPGAWRVERRTLRGGLSEGVELIELDNGDTRLFVLPTRGMGIWKVELPDRTLGWRSPVRGPVHPQFVPLDEPSGLGWLDGFDEFLVRCGLESNGAPDFNEQGQLVYPLHGRIANRPAHQVDVGVDDEAGTITLRGIVEETRFHFQKLRLQSTLTTSLGSTSFSVRDRVENFGGTPAEMQMLYHLNIGEPLLHPGDQLIAPVRRVSDRSDPQAEDLQGWNHYGSHVPGQREDCYYAEMQADEAGQTQVLLKHAAGTQGTRISYNVDALPYFTLWKNLVASEDGYVTGLEPATNYPNPRSEEKANGRVVVLQPGESWSAELVVDALTGAEQVAEAEASIERLKQQS